MDTARRSSWMNFNPRSPCGERLSGISSLGLSARYFNPRSPCGERRSEGFIALVVRIISIHAPRVGSDSRHIAACSPRRHFNPRSPCGERPQTRAEFERVALFQSTLPVWGATVYAAIDRADGAFQSTLPVWGATKLSDRPEQYECISIHAPRVGSDITRIAMAARI